jgi:hypothetical protein
VRTCGSREPPGTPPIRRANTFFFSAFWLLTRCYTARTAIPLRLRACIFHFSFAPRLRNNFSSSRQLRQSRLFARRPRSPPPSLRGSIRCSAVPEGLASRSWLARSDQCLSTLAGSAVSQTTKKGQEVLCLNIEKSARASERAGATSYQPSATTHLLVQIRPWPPLARPLQLRLLPPSRAPAESSKCKSGFWHRKPCFPTLVSRSQSDSRPKTNHTTCTHHIPDYGA